MHMHVCKKDDIFRQTRRNHSGVGGGIAFRRVYPARAYTTLVVLVILKLCYVRNYTVTSPLYCHTRVQLGNFSFATKWHYFRPEISLEFHKRKVLVGSRKILFDWFEHQKHQIIVAKLNLYSTHLNFNFG